MIKFDTYGDSLLKNKSLVELLKIRYILYLIVKTGDQIFIVSMLSMSIDAFSLLKESTTLLILVSQSFITPNYKLRHLLLNLFAIL